MLNTAAGIANVDPQTRDAAVGVGLTGRQVLTRVEVPNALPLILAGVRSAANQVIATATILGFKAQGGLGLFIFSGYGTQRYDAVVRRVDRRRPRRAHRRGAVRPAPAAHRLARSASVASDTAPASEPASAAGVAPRRPASFVTGVNGSNVGR